MTTDETKTLPTAPGWYVRSGEPLTEISTIFLLNNLGDWWDGHRHATEGEILHYAPLTRLVKETDTAQRPEVDMKAAVEEFSMVSSGNYDEDFEIVLRRVLAGEFDL